MELTDRIDTILQYTMAFSDIEYARADDIMPGDILYMKKNMDVWRERI